MLKTKIFPLALAACALTAGFSNSAAAHDSRFKRGEPDCRQVVQVVEIAGIFKLKEYGTACTKYDGTWRIASKHPHRSRTGNDLYIWNHGHLVKYNEDRPRKYYHHHKRRW